MKGIDALADGVEPSDGKARKGYILDSRIRKYQITRAFMSQKDETKKKIEQEVYGGGLLTMKDLRKSYLGEYSLSTPPRAQRKGGLRAEGSGPEMNSGKRGEWLPTTSCIKKRDKPSPWWKLVKLYR